jgi:protein-S-isoprenylcysteine O-methyltransferase Ste14
MASRRWTVTAPVVLASLLFVVGVFLVVIDKPGPGWALIFVIGLPSVGLALDYALRRRHHPRADEAR